MSNFKSLAKEKILENIITEFVNSQHKSNQILCEGLNTKSGLYLAIQLGEQTAKQIQVDILNEYIDEHPVLKEDIFQRGLAKAKAYLTTPLGKGFGQAKDTQVIQNLFASLKKNTERIVSAGPSPFAPSAEDLKNSPTQIGQIGALIGKRFAALQNNPKLNAPATPAEIQAGMGKIEQLISKLRASGMVKGADKVLDEIGIFARQHPLLTNMIVAGLVAVLTLSTGGGLFGIPLLGKFLTGTALRTLIGMLKGEKAAQAATKGAVVSGTGIAIGKLLGLFYDKLAGWIGGQADGSALPVPPKPVPQPMDVDTSVLGKEEYLSSYRNDLINKALNAASSEEYQTIIQQVKNMDAQYDFNGDIPEYDATSASGQLPTTPAAPAAPVTPAAVPPAAVPSSGGTLPPEPPPVTGVDIQPTLTTLRPKLDALARLASTTDVRGATAPAARQAVQSWVNSISQPEAQVLLKDPNVANQLLRKGALGLLKKKFNIQESELDMLKAELMGGAVVLTEANPLTAAKNFMFGGPEVGGKNSRLDYKQVESDYLKFLNNMESSLGLKSEKDILDFLRTKDKVFPGIYDYVKKVRDWLYGATPESNNKTPEPIVVPPQEVPKPNEQPTQQPTQQPTPPVIGGPDEDGFKMDVTTLRNVKMFLTRLIELGNALNKANAQNLDKATLKSLATSSLSIGDILVNKKGAGKPNPLLDKVLQGIDILGPLPPAKDRQASTVKPVSSVFTEATGYNNPELTKQINALKNNPLFKGLQQRVVNLLTIGSGAGFNNLDNRESIKALRKVLSDVNGVITKFSPQVSQKLGANPAAIRKELEADKGFVKEIASQQERTLFVKQLTEAMPQIIGLMSLLRQAFNRKNPNNIYKLGAQSAGKPQQSGSQPKEKLIIRAKDGEKPLTPNYLYQYFNGKWHVVNRTGITALNPEGGSKNIVDKLNDLAKKGRDDKSLVIQLSKENPAFNQGAFKNLQKESRYKLSDYKKFF